MNAIAVNQENVYAKILALSTIYEKEESRRQMFLEKMTYTPREMKAVINTVRDDFEFRSWIERAIPVMKCRKLNFGRFFPKLDDLVHISISNINWRKIVQIWRSFDLYSI